MKTIYIIPGNPGHPIFYESFIKLLKKTTEYNVVINPLPGHTLETQHKKCKMKNIIRYHTKEIKKYDNVILVGHSIGCFFGLQVAKRVTNIDKIILLFPTIVHMATTPQGEFTNKIEPLYKFIAPIAEYLPNSLSNWLVKSEHGHHVFHKQIVLNCLALWDEEKVAVTTPENLHFTPLRIENAQSALSSAESSSLITAIASLEGGVLSCAESFAENERRCTKDKQDYLVIYSTRDDWTPPHVVQILKQMFPNIVETECDHAFVLNENDYTLVCKYIQTFV
jgi:pimeloyl-ACP methyl ester carboxylesterase